MKLFKKLFIVFTVIILLIIVLLGISIFLLYDNSIKDNEYRNYPNDMEYELSSISADALKDTSTTKIIDASLTEDKINYLLQAITNTLNKVLKEKVNVKGAKVEIDDDNKTKISIYFQVLGFPSSLKGDFVLKETEDNIYFQVLNAGAGKIKANHIFIGSLAKTFVDEKTVKDELLKKGIVVNINLKELLVSIDKDKIPSMVLDLLKDDPNNRLYSTLSSIVLENDLIKIISSNHELGADAYLEKLAYDKQVFYDIPYNFDYDNIKTKTETLLNTNIITYKQAGFVFDYLVRGYEKVTKDDEEHQYDFIKNLNLTSIGIYSNTTYKGILDSPKKSMTEVILSQSPTLTDLFNDSLDFKIYESDINNILFNSGVIGISYAFASKVENSYFVSYLYVESLYSHIENNNLEIIITININGYNIALKCSASTNGKNEGLTITTLVTSVNMGSIYLKDEEISSILSYLNEALQDEEWISCNIDTKEINFNFTKIFTTNNTLNEIVKKSSKTNCALIKDTNEGYIKISLSGLL